MVILGCESFAEVWLNAGTIESQQGAVAIAAASTNMQWVHLILASEANLVLMVNGTSKTLEDYLLVECPK